MTSAHVIEVREQDFQQQVMEASKTRPVLVDFWATWCGPCQVLGPVLEKLAEEMNGAFLLAKVDTDQNPNLAAALQIRSIPTVHLFVDGRPVDGFMGALPESQVREFLAPYVKGPAGGAPQDAVDEVDALLAAGNEAEARATLERRVADDPSDASAQLVLARLAFDEGDEARCRKHVEAIGEEADEVKLARALLDAFRFRKDCPGDEAPLRARVEADGGDLDARYALGCCLAAAGRFEAALAQFLEIVKRDKRHKDGAAHQSMLTIFALLPPGSDLARAYRRQLVLHT